MNWYHQTPKAVNTNLITTLSRSMKEGFMDSSTLFHELFIVPVIVGYSIFFDVTVIFASVTLKLGYVSFPKNTITM